MRKIIIVILLFVAFFDLKAQSNMLLESKVVLIGTETPVEEATVKVEEKNLSVITDDKGMFSFEEVLPEGKYLISVNKEGYEPKVFLVEQKKDFKIKLPRIELTFTKKELKRRRNEEKDAKNQLKNLEKEKLRKEKALQKEKERLLKDNSVDVQYVETENLPVKETKEEKIEEISPNQIKYAKVLGVDVVELTNRDLYDFIDRWMGTPYLMGGETKKAIDCSSFAQRLFITSYDKIYLERTAQKQFNSEFTELYKNKKHLKEGDLLFFGKDQFNISHVGVYLHNDRFIHSTGRSVDGPSGVKISNITSQYWSNIFISAGRRKKE